MSPGGEVSGLGVELPGRDFLGNGSGSSVLPPSAGLAWSASCRAGCGRPGIAQTSLV